MVSTESLLAPLPTDDGRSSSRLPNFLCIGAPKAGTTTLHDLLTSHPNIAMPTRIKEAHFFDEDRNFERGITWYRNLFSTNSATAAVGEVTPRYLVDQRVPRRVRQVLGTDLKLIVLLRHPVARAFSHYLHNQQRGAEDRPFLEAFQNNIGSDPNPQYDNEMYDYVGRSRYADHLRRWFDEFPVGNFRIFIFEETIASNLQGMWDDILEFVQVPPAPLPGRTESNVSTAPRSIRINKSLWHLRPYIAPLLRPVIRNPERRQHLWTRITSSNRPPDVSLEPALKKELFEREFSDDVETLERMLGRDLAVWYR